jgi:hypothetical protein
MLVHASKIPMPERIPVLMLQLLVPRLVPVVELQLEPAPDITI